MANVVMIHATERDVRRIAANAVVAAIPVGQNIFHKDPGFKITWEDIDPEPNGDILLTVFKDRPINLMIARMWEGLWKLSVCGDLLLTEHSWCREYKTLADLARSVHGVRVVE